MMRRGFGDLPVYTDPSGFSTVDPFGLFADGSGIGAGAATLGQQLSQSGSHVADSVTTATSQALSQAAQNLGHLPTSGTAGTSTNWTILAIIGVGIFAMLMMGRK